MLNDEPSPGPGHDWYDTTPLRPADPQQLADKEKTAQARLRESATHGRLPKADKERWAAAENFELISRVLIATTYSNGHELADLDSTDIAAGLALVEPARRDLQRLEAQLIMVARHQNLTWRSIAEALGLQSAQAAAQRWQRLTGAAAPPNPTATPPPKTVTHDGQ